MDKNLERHKNYAIRLLSDLISIPTLPDGEHYGEFSKYMREVLRDLGVKANIIKVPKEVVEKYVPEYEDNPRYIITARIGKKKPILHFNGHYDVVPPGDGWIYDPFKATVKDDVVIGRGASDMKGGIAAIITAVKAVLESDVKLKGSIELSFVPDEEIGGFCGAKYLVDNFEEKPKWAIVAEPSGINRVYIGHKGVVWGEITVFGKSAHASVPIKGENAVEKCVKLVNEIIKLKERITSRVTSYPTGYKNATLEITMIEGGFKENVVPDRAIVKFDRRVLPEEDLQNVEAELKEIIEDANMEANVKFEFRTIFKAEPFVNSNSKISSILEEILFSNDLSPITEISSGFMDLRFFGQQGVDVVAYGPGVPEAAHAANEYIRIDDLMMASKVFYDLILKTVAK